MIFNIITIILINFISLNCAKKQIPIGGIFPNDNSDAEIAFRSAVIRENMYNPKMELIPIIRKIDLTDSFQAEKIACALASEGVVAIFGPSSIESYGIVASICQELGIPHIIVHWTPEHYDVYPNHQYTRNFFPDHNLFNRALAQIIADYEWDGFTLVYENNDSLERLQEVLQIHGPDDNPVTVRQLSADGDYKPLLKEIQLSGESYIILDCSPDKVMDILRQATSVKMMEEYQSYIITSLDSHIYDFEELKYFRANVTTIRLMSPTSFEVMNAVHDWRQGEIRQNGSYIYADRIRTEAALMHDAVRVFAGTLREFNAIKEVQPTSLRCSHTNKWNQGIQILQLMEQKTEEGMTGRIIFNEEGRRADFYIEILQLHQDDGLRKIATYDPITDRLNYTRSPIEVFTEISKSLQNKTIIVAARIGMPFLRLREPEEGEHLQGNDRYEGYSVDLIDSIAKILGFQYRFELVPDNNYGSYNKKTKKWDGLVKHLLDRKADLAICDLTITYERRTAVDFTMPFMTLGISILYAKPKKEPPGLFSFMSPLSLELWVNIATAYLFVSIMLFLMAKFANADWENPHPCNDNPEELETLWNMPNSIWLVAASVMQQGSDILPKASPTRVISGLWYFFALIVISSYTANLAAFLTMERMDASIESAEDLSKQSAIKYGAVLGGSTLQFFKTSNFSIYQRMWAAMESTEPSPFTRSNDEGEERVSKGNRMYAFLMESTAIEYIINRNCNLTQIGGLLDSKGYGIAMPVNSPYRTHISQTVLKMAEDGKLQRLKRKWWLEKNNEKGCDDDHGSGQDAPELGMGNVGGVFLVLITGLGIAFFVGILEFLWNVSRVAVDEKMTPWESFKKEFMFSLDIRITEKQIINHDESESLSEHSSSGSSNNSGNSKSKSMASRQNRDNFVTNNGNNDIIVQNN